MSAVSSYFCVFCDFNFEEYNDALNHYCSHMYANGNCELCDYNNLLEYKADSSDLSKTCQCCELNFDLNSKSVTRKNVIHNWIKMFLSYQNKILDTSCENLLLENNVCEECPVCRYFLVKYMKSGGNKNRVKYICDKKVEHCYQHMRYEPNSEHILPFVDIYKNRLRLKRIMKLELFVNTFFTESNQLSNNDSLVTIYKDTLQYKEDFESKSKLSPWIEKTLKYSLAPILANLSAIESAITDTKCRLDSEMKNIECKLDDFESDLKKSLQSYSTPPGTVAHFACINAPLGWLKADGRIVSRLKYAKLFEAIGTTFGCGDKSLTFKLPDLRGEFIRCWSDGKDVDKARNFGSFQWGSSIPMGGNGSSSRVGFIDTNVLEFAGSSFDNSFENKINLGQSRNGIIYPNDHYLNYIDIGSTSHLSSWNVLKGTRPRNIALLACIKY